MRLTRKLILILSTLGVVLAGCTDPPPEVPQAVIPETTKVVDASTGQALVAYDSQSGLMRFAATTDVLASLKPDDVLVAGTADAAPFGFLRKVKGIRAESDGSVVLETVQADLTEAIHRGEFDEEWFLTDDNLLETTIYVQGLSIEPAMNKWFEEYWILTFDEVILDYEENGQRVFTKVDGTVTMRPWAHFGFEIDSELLDVWIKRAEASVGFDQTSNLHFTTTAHAEFEREFKVASLRFARFDFSIAGVPITISIFLNVYVGANGEANVRVEFTIDEKFDVRLGAGYFKNQGGWKNLSEGPNLSVGFREPPTIEGNAEISGYTAAEVAIMLYDVVGPAIGLRTGVSADIAYPRDPLWRLYGWLEGYFRFIADFPVVGRVADYKATLFDVWEEFSRSPNSSPEVTVTTRTPKVDLNIPVDLTKYISVFDPEEGRLTGYKITSNRDGAINRSAQVFTTQGLRTLTVTATDKQGLSASATFDVDVINTPPTVYGTSMNTMWFADIPTYVNVFAIDPNDTLGCEALTWVTDAREKSFEAQGAMCLARLVFSAPPSGENSAIHLVTVTATDPQGAVSEPVSFELTISGAPSHPVPIVKSVRFEGCTAENCIGGIEPLKPGDTAVIPIGGSLEAIVVMEPFVGPLEFRVYEWAYWVPTNPFDPGHAVTLVGASATDRITFVPAYQGLNDYHVTLTTQDAETFTAGSQYIRIEWYRPVN